jgi:PTH1 family peptidyl-tRNA hydrolase
MGHTTEALLYYVQTNDLKNCRKKFAKSRKLPSKLESPETLVYPVHIDGM